MARPLRPVGATQPQGRTSGPKAFPWGLVAGLVFAGCVSLYTWQALTAGEPVATGLFLMPVLVVLSAPVLITARRAAPGFDLAGLMATGLALRFVGAYFRWAGAFDAHVYHQVGSELAQSFRAFQFDVDVGAPVPGTGALRYIAGLVSVPSNSDEFLTFLFFTWFGFWGCVLLYRAFVTAIPDGDHRRYAKLIFLWPSLVFWPSSIGKESWIILTLGLAMLGAARVLRRRHGGYSLVVVGLLGMSLVRPHVALLALAAFTVALLVGRRGDARPGVVTPGSVGKVVGLVVVLALGAVLANRTSDLLDIENVGGSSADSTLERVRLQTGQGGSQFTPPNPQSPIGYPTAVVTTLFRPLPIEARGSEQLATALEGLVLAVLFVRSRHRLVDALRRLRDQPYVILALGYLLMFAYAFSAISNFGILARQRVQVLPFVFVLLAVPAVARAAKRRPAHAPPRRW